MAQQCGPLIIIGTIDEVCFYRMNGKYYARMKSSLTRKRVMKDPAFRRTREHAAVLGEASKIASRVYRLITGEHKKHALYREITGKAIYLLRERKDPEEVIEILCLQYLKQERMKQTAEAAPYARRKEAEKNVNSFCKVSIIVAAPELRKVPVPILRLQTRKRRGRFRVVVNRTMQLTQGP